MLSQFWTSIFRPVFIGLASDNDCFASSSDPILWLLGICVNSTWSDSCVKSLVNFRYFYILSSFASNSPFIWPTMSFESLWKSKFLTLSAFLTLSPINTPLYSSSLLVAENSSWTQYLSISPSRVMIMNPILPLFGTGEPSVWIVHLSTSFVAPSSSGIVNLTLKSANSYALIAILGWYSMSNWLSLIAH